MDAVAERLVRQDDRLIQPLTPPFDKTDHDPSYIKGYPPRERENGGQYTHAALWTVWAFVGVGSRAVHHIRVENADGVQTGVKGTVLDGEHTEPGEIPLADDEKGHEVVLWMGRDS
jgi:cellobiose phosphorylase